MAHSRTPVTIPALARLLAAAFALAAVGAQAAPFQLTYTGSFDSQEALNPASAGSPIFFSGLTPFTVNAWFDDSSPNLAPAFGGPFNGFRAYAPSRTTIDIAGTRYTVEGALANPAAGVTVAIFDQTSFTPGRYGVGLIADPVGDGAGFVGDFASASPDFTVDALRPTVFTDYHGVGHGSGVCVSGTPPACQHAVTPWVLYDADNVAWSLTFANYEEDYPAVNRPGVPLGPLNTARIAAVPEPATYGLVLAGLAGLVWTTARRRRR